MTAADIISNLIASSVKQNSSVAENLPLKISGNTDFKGKTFDSLLSNAAKSYADTISSSTNSFNSKDYAKNTKDITSAHNNASKANDSKNENTSGIKDSNTSQTEDKNTSSKIENNTVKENSKETNNIDEKKDIKDDVVDNNGNIKETAADKEPEKTDTTEKTEDIKNQESSFENETEKSESETVKDENTKSESTGTKTQTENQTAISKNTIVNEQIIANIEYTADTPAKNLSGQQISSQTTNTETQNIETPPENNQTVSKTAQTDATIQNAQAILNSEEATVSSAINTAMSNTDKTAQNAVQGAAPDKIQNTLQTPVSQQETNSIIADNAPDVEINIDVDNTNSQKLNTEANTAVLKTAKENLASDTSRLTVNIENAANSEDTSVITPTAKAENSNTQNAEPLIKVTDEVASQAKQNENLPVNKDFAGAAKDKALGKMSELQNTNTVVSQTQTAGQNQAQTNSNRNNNASSKSNAAEQVIKFSVDNTTNTTNAAESFLGKLDAKLTASSKAAPQSTLLNKSDIMSQMNAKFNELSQSGQNKVSIILQPENLGKVSVEIMNSKDGIIAKMTTENHQVKELFDKNIDALKSSLGSQGVNVNNIKVECTNESSNNAMNFEREQFNQSSFNNSNGQNRQTHNSEQNNQSIYTNDYTSSDDSSEEITNTPDIKNTNTLIKHNGKVDYTV